VLAENDITIEALKMLLSRKKVLSTSATIRALSVGITATGLLIAMDMAGHEEDKDGMKRKTVSIPPRYFGSLTSISGIAPINTRCDEFRRVPPPPSSRLRKRKTVEMFEHTASEGSLESKYSVQWQKPLAEGAFGVVYQATNLETGEEVAVKKISKQLTDHAGFQREMDALMHLRENGGHPNICGLRENFDEDGYYYVVLDLITGGEMFDHLISKGAYSEADAARLIREIASALAFLHGIGVVHGDMKPENLMLSSQLSSAAVIKVVDFGCAQVENYSNRKGVTSTLAYCPPEYLDKKKRGPCIHPPFDMWALGVILYIMLTGGHPFDLYGDASDADVVLKVLSGQKPPLQNSPFTAHLSADAVNVIESLLQWNPDKRPTAQQLLQDPWVLGEKARRDKIANSGKRLSTYRAFTTKLEAKVFADMVSLSNTGKMDEEVKRTSLIERAFHLMEPDGLGFVTSASLRKLTDDGDSLPIGEDDEGLSLSKFEDLLSENLKNRYFPKDFVVYNEGDGKTGSI
jgi:serine/threonine protein kinase